MTLPDILHDNSYRDVVADADDVDNVVNFPDLLFLDQLFVISLSGQFTMNGLINVLSNSPSLEEQVLSYLQGVTNIYIHHMQLLVNIEGWVVIEY